MRTALVVLLVGGVISSVAMAETAPQPEEEFRRAVAACDAGKYAEAGEGFRKLLAEGYDEARVHYNLSCALFRAGDLGGAILHAETASSLDPGDLDTRANLEFLRSRAVDRDSGPAGFSNEAVVRIVDRFARLLPPNALAAGVLGGEWIAALCVFLALRRSRRGQSGRPAWITGACAVLIALVAASGLGLVAWRRESFQEAVVLPEKADALAGPGSGHPVLFSVHAGLKVRVEGVREGWMQVRLPSGLSGWLQQDEVGKIVLP